MTAFLEGGNPYDIARITEAVLRAVLDNDLERARKGIAIFEQLGIRAAVYPLLRDILAGTKKLSESQGMFFVRDAAAVSQALPTEALEQMVSARAGAMQMLERESPLLVFVLVPTFGQFALTIRDLPGCALIRLPIDSPFDEGMLRILWHEMGHAFLLSRNRFLDEGWAAWFERYGARVEHWQESARSALAQVSPQNMSLTNLLGESFSRALQFESHFTDGPERQAVYLKGALLIDQIVTELGAPVLSQLFADIYTDPGLGHADKCFKRYLGCDVAALEARLVVPSRMAEHTPRASERFPTSAEVLAARAANDLVSLEEFVTHSPAFAAATTYSAAQRIEMQLSMLTALIEQGPQPEKEQLQELNAIADSFMPYADSASRYALLGRALLCQIRYSDSVFERAMKAGRAKEMFDAATGLDADEPDALIGLAILLIHTPPQFGGDLAAGLDLLRKVATRKDAHGEIAYRILSKLVSAPPIASPADKQSTALLTETPTETPSVNIGDTPLLLIVELEAKISESFSLRLEKLVVRAGEIVCLLGPNGAGKSVCLDACLGLTASTAKRHELCSETIVNWRRRPEVRKALGASLQRSLFDRDFKVKEVLALVGAAYGQVDRELVNQFGITEFSSQSYGSLSTGQRQRVNLLIALHPEAKLLLLDEPTLSLDEWFARSLPKLLLSRAARGAGVLLVSHDERMLKLADRVLLLAGGAICAEGSPEKLQTQFLADFRMEVQADSDVEWLRLFPPDSLPMLLRRPKSLVMFGDDTAHQRFLRAVEDLHPSGYTVRHSRVEDLLEVAAGFAHASPRGGVDVKQLAVETGSDSA